ncbi:hypothetical protein QBC39DRAFT_344137 [Podospora conica]|nr:hypothetical protein QBC39DRAFT_344137 [Schizothecium conicum]
MERKAAWCFLRIPSWVGSTGIIFALTMDRAGWVRCIQPSIIGGRLVAGPVVDFCIYSLLPFGEAISDLSHSVIWATGGWSTRACLHMMWTEAYHVAFIDMVVFQRWC